MTLCPKIVGGKNCQKSFRFFPTKNKTKKNSGGLKLEGGGDGKALIAQPLKDIFV